MTADACEAATTTGCADPAVGVVTIVVVVEVSVVEGADAEAVVVEADDGPDWSTGFVRSTIKSHYESE